MVLVLLAVVFIAGRLRAPNLPVTSLVIGDESLRVLVADTATTREQGLSGRTLCPRCGMLFDFGQELPNLEFWMRGMLIDLDMLWLDSSGHEVHRAENVPRPECLSVDACPPARRSTDRPARYVLELPAGTLATLKGNPLSVTLGTLGP